MKWTKYQPEFDFMPDCKSHVWFGHCFFAYDLIRNTKPQVIVELGTYYATSFSSFCQAVKDEDLGSELFAVDTWKGDEHSGFYGEYVYQHADAMIRKYYPNQKTKLMRMYFDDAVNEFKNKSIDLLHIDGLHTYEAVKHDFETWFPKVKENGVIMLHDTRVENYGVKDLWKELKESHYEWGFLNFEHNYGLGVIFLDKSNFMDLFGESFDETELIKYYSNVADNSVGMEQIINVETDRANIRRELELVETDRANIRRELELVETDRANIRRELELIEQHAQKLLKEREEMDKALEEARLLQSECSRLKSRKIIRLINKFFRLFGKPLY